MRRDSPANRVFVFQVFHMFQPALGGPPVGVCAVVPDLLIEARWRARVAGPVAGVDEVGRGPWAGPVVAAAVVLDVERIPAALLAGLADSKVLPRARREELAGAIRVHAAIGLGRADVAEVDALNVLEASMLAMRRAVAALERVPGALLVDGNRMPTRELPGEAVVGGDGRSASIAAASIVAKVARDRLMAAHALQHVGYGWERNAGYGTAEHRRAIERLGVTDLHRRSFAPIRKLLNLVDS
jgi:ribonuclease HII